MVELPNLGSHTKIYNKHCATSAARAHRSITRAGELFISFFPDNFLEVMEKDAEIRRVRRLEQEKKATGL